MGKNFGDFMKRLREDHQYTLQDVERMTQISNTYLSQIERGERILHFKVLQRLAEIYQIPVATMEQAADEESKSGLDAQLDAQEEAFVSRGYKQLSETRRQELKNFLQYLLQEQQRKGR